MADNTQKNQVDIIIKSSKGYNKIARKAILYSLIAVWFTHKNKNVTEFCDFVHEKSGRFIEFEKNITYNVNEAAAEAVIAANAAKPSRIVAIINDIFNGIIRNVYKAARNAANAAIAENVKFACDAARGSSMEATLASNAELIYKNAANTAKSEGEEISKSNACDAAIIYLIAAYIYLM